MEQTAKRTPRVLWHNILFMGLTPIFAAILIPTYIAVHGWSWGLFALFAIPPVLFNQG